MTRRVVLFDYGAGNLHSLRKVLEAGGREVVVEADPMRCVDADLLVLPGVGSFQQAATSLAPARAELRDAIRAGLPTIGVCLGMHLLLETSDEGEGRGLGVVPGTVRRLDARRVPQMGWNDIEDISDQLIADAGLDTAYYANSFVCAPEDESIVTAWSTHEGDRFPAALRAGNALGVQFHPEKSSANGVRFLRSAVEALAR